MFLYAPKMEKHLLAENTKMMVLEVSKFSLITLLVLMMGFHGVLRSEMVLANTAIRKNWRPSRLFRKAEYWLLFDEACAGYFLP